MTQLTRQFTLRFSAPAFLGNAHQSAQWRTPPIKALLRQCWRMAWAAEHGFKDDWQAMREEEGRLFGHAWLKTDRDTDGKEVAGRKSRVRLRLGHWEQGKLGTWQGLEEARVKHPEAEKAQYKVGPHAYLGFGPLDAKGGTQLAKIGENIRIAIQPGEHARFALAFPADAAPLIDAALRLMHAWGTLGGRSRNGWGSFTLTGEDETSRALLAAPALATTDWQTALQLDWPHAVGHDTRGALVWQTAPHADWRALMKTLAEIKIALRTQFRFTTGKGASQPEERHWLSYPVTNHSVQGWGNLRLPNTLRFKLRPHGDGGQLVGAIFHMPCQPPGAFRPDFRTLASVWQQVHRHLDATASLTRIPA